MEPFEYLNKVITMVNDSMKVQREDNTQRLINWLDRMMKKTGLCGAVLSEALAEFCDESGNESPSDYAMVVARQWETDHAELKDYINNSGKWCRKPSWGCIHLCDKWKEVNRQLLTEDEEDG